MNRPQWARDIHIWVNDGIYDLFPEGDLAVPEVDSLVDNIITNVNDALCDYFGHEIIDDQCLIPAHRFCQWCNRLESNL